MTDYHVVPAALRQAQQSWDYSADVWQEFAAGLGGRAVLSEHSMGVIGRMAGFTKDYNNAVDEIRGKADSGSSQLKMTGHALAEVAGDYERRDEAYYRKFGYIDEH
jgi:hypothetical protein